MPRQQPLQRRGCERRFVLPHRQHMVRQEIQHRVIIESPDDRLRRNPSNTLFQPLHGAFQDQ